MVGGGVGMEVLIPTITKGNNAGDDDVGNSSTKI